VGGPPHDAGAKVLRCERRAASTDIQQILNVGASKEIFEIERVRSVAGIAFSLQTSFVPASLCGGLQVNELTGDLSDDHLYDLLEKKCGVIFARAEEYLEPVVADEYVADVLSIDAGSPLFLVERFCYTRQDVIGEYRRAFQRGDMYRHRIDLR
jgi:DNA-binding GntR family transcriptional regulator